MHIYIYIHFYSAYIYILLIIRTQRERERCEVEDDVKDTYEDIEIIKLEVMDKNMTVMVG